jgi:hypothetical protein
MYTVKWDLVLRRYIASDDSGTRLGVSGTKGLAMEIARLGAMNAANERRVKITVMAEDDNGKLRKHWTFAPPSAGRTRDRS